MRALILSTLLIGLLSLSVNAQTINDSLMAFYPFNGSALDMSDNGNDGSIYGATPTTDRFDNPNSAYEFNGVTDYIDLNSSFDFEERSISLWANTYALPSNNRHIYVSDNPDLNHGFTQILSTVFEGQNVSKSSACVAGGLAYSFLSLNTWHMITISIGADSVKHYFDGEYIHSTPVGSVTSQFGQETALLGTSRLYDRYFVGKIDDVRIYNRCLLPDEVGELFTQDPLGVFESSNLAANLISFPNPVSGQLPLTIDNPEQTRYSLLLYTIEGQLVREIVNVKAVQVEMDINDLSPGLYFLHQHRYGSVTSVSKVIVE